MMNKRWGCLLLQWVAISWLLAGCASNTYQKVGPTPIIQAEEEISQEQLLDVGIVPFTSDEMTEEEAEDEGTNPDIRKAESHFMAYHLKNTLHSSSQWGAIGVLPASEGDVDVLIEGNEIARYHSEDRPLDLASPPGPRTPSRPPRSPAQPDVAAPPVLAALWFVGQAHRSSSPPR